MLSIHGHDTEFAQTILPAETYTEAEVLAARREVRIEEQLCDSKGMHACSRAFMRVRVARARPCTKQMGDARYNKSASQ